MPGSLRRQLIAATLAATSMAGPAPAAEIEIAPPITEALFTPYPTSTGEGMRLSGAWVDLSGYHHIRLTGEIVPGDADRLRDVLSGIDPWPFGNTILSLSSPGGSFSEALEIGDILSGRGIGSYVADGDICLSACAFAFLGGRRMVVRNVLWEPWRHLHEGGTLGFHSPSLPGGVPRSVLETVGEDVLFAEIAAPTLDNIRELQARAASWTLSGALLFEILGRVGAEQFFFLERMEEATSSWITVVDAHPPVYSGLGVIEARLACEIVLRERFREGPGDIYAAGINNNFPHPGFLRTVLSTVVSDPVDLGQEAFHIEMFLPGSGNPVCTVWQGDAGFMVAYDSTYFGEGPFMVTELSGDGRTFVAVHPHATIGYGLPWARIGDERLYLEGEDALSGDWPSDYLQRAESYDFCAPRNPDTWAIICRFETVHDAIRLLTAIVETNRPHPEADAIYAAWQEDAARFCRPRALMAGDTLRETMLGYCALAVTLRQLDRAAALWLAGGE